MNIHLTFSSCILVFITHNTVVVVSLGWTVLLKTVHSSSMHPCS